MTWGGTEKGPADREPAGGASYVGAGTRPAPRGLFSRALNRKRPAPGVPGAGRFLE